MKEQTMNRIIRIMGIAGVSCLVVMPALAQSQTVPPKNPADTDSNAAAPMSQPTSPSTKPMPKRGGLMSNRGNQDVQAPRENQNVQAPRQNQDVQAPRENQNVQAPRQNQDVQAPRENQNVQAPRDKQDLRGLSGKRMDKTQSMRSMRAAQEMLKAKGFDPGDLDGRYGPKTRAAISSFQKSVGIRESGRLDDATMSQLGVSSTSMGDTGQG
jgi:murein L,D-transpeptidase YcbB/YkuD